MTNTQESKTQKPNSQPAEQAGRVEVPITKPAQESQKSAPADLASPAKETALASQTETASKTSPSARKNAGPKSSTPHRSRTTGSAKSAGRVERKRTQPASKDKATVSNKEADSSPSSRNTPPEITPPAMTSAPIRPQTPEQGLGTDSAQPTFQPASEKGNSVTSAPAPRADADSRPSEKDLPGAIPDSPTMREILEHGQRVAAYTDILFKELEALHGLSPEWGRRLHLAACLHDLGWLEGRKGHHKTSMRIIDEDLSLPISDDDRPWVALLARYHRKAVPSRKHPRFAMLKRPQQEMLRKAAALLRLADALDYSHKGIIQDFTVTVGKNKIILQATCTEDCTEEAERCKEKGGLFARVFKKEPKLVCLPQ